jgi:hypothetical protein
VAFGGKPLMGHKIPAQYGAVEPTAVFVPLSEILKPQYFDLVTTEVFGPFQVTVRVIHLAIYPQLAMLCWSCFRCMQTTSACSSMHSSWSPEANYMT